VSIVRARYAGNSGCPPISADADSARRRPTDSLITIKKGETEMKMNINKLLSWCKGEGIKARNESPERQSMVQMVVKEKLEVSRDEISSRLKLYGNYLTAKLQDLGERLKEACMNMSIEVHRRNYRIGIIYTIPLILIIFAEIWLNNWMFSPFQLAFEGLLLSLVITVVGAMSVDLMMKRLKEGNPIIYSRIKLILIILAVVLLIVIIPTLSDIRGELTQAKKESDNLNETVEKSEAFYKKASGPLVRTMLLLGFSMFVTAGLLLHEASGRLVVSGRAVKIQKEIDRIRRKLIQLGEALESCQHLVRLGMIEFKMGLYRGIREERKYWLTSASFFLVFLLSSGFIHASEQRSVSALFDITKSTRCNDYSGESEFQKNHDYISLMLEQLNHDTTVKVIGITGTSFKEPYVMLDGYLSKERGAFGEVLAKNKLSIIKHWEEQDLKPISNETDIFSALFLVSLLMKDESQSRSLIILSDMRNSVGVNIENLPVIGDAEIKKVEDENLIPDLAGIRVYCLGVSPCGKSLKYWQSLERFWKIYFQKAGAELVCFSIERKFKLD